MSTIFFDSDETLYAEKMAKVKAEVDVALFVSESCKIDFHKVHAVFLDSKNKIMALNPADPNRNNRALWCQDMLRELNLAGPDPEMLCDKYWGIVLGEIKPYPDLMVVLPGLETLDDCSLIMLNRFNVYPSDKTGHGFAKKAFAGLMEFRQAYCLKAKKISITATKTGRYSYCATARS